MTVATATPKRAAITDRAAAENSIGRRLVLPAVILMLATSRVPAENVKPSAAARVGTAR